MIEIEFRGKSKFDKNKKWVYGDLIKGENTYISTKEEFYSAVVSLGGHLSTFVELVDKETIGQFTGLKDKNGKKIFAGDIVKVDFNTYDDNDYISNTTTIIGEVYFDTNEYAYKVVEHLCIDGDGFEDYDYFSLCDYVGCEVMGNIYDNPELLTHQHEDKGE